MESDAKNSPTYIDSSGETTPTTSSRWVNGKAFADGQKRARNNWNLLKSALSSSPQKLDPMRKLTAPFHREVRSGWHSHHPNSLFKSSIGYFQNMSNSAKKSSHDSTAAAEKYNFKRRRSTSHFFFPTNLETISGNISDAIQGMGSVFATQSSEQGSMEEGGVSATTPLITKLDKVS